MTQHRLALNTDHLIQGQLGISDHNHKNKLILKAMDLVLFGPPKGNYATDSPNIDR